MGEFQSVHSVCTSKYDIDMASWGSGGVAAEEGRTRFRAVSACVFTGRGGRRER